MRQNNAPIEPLSIQNSTNQGNSLAIDPFFTPWTSARRQTTTSTQLRANPRAPKIEALNLFKDFANKLANPTSLYAKNLTKE
jgi:hypothetical protein